LNLHLTVSTADGVPIVGAEVTLGNDSPATTDSTGSLQLTPSANTFTINVSMLDYLSQVTTVVVADDGSMTWDDPGTSVSNSAGQTMVVIRLGRLVPAPAVATTGKDLDNNTLAIPANTKNPSSYIVPLQNTFTVEQGQYAFLFAGERRFWAALGPTIVRDPGKSGWDALSGTSSSITPNMSALFTWLEWAPPGGSPTSLNRYLLGIWRPRSSVVPGIAPRDAIVFFTPNTADSRGYLADQAPYRKNYPYALNAADGSTTVLAQRYVTLGLRYIFNEKFLAYQLLAAARDMLLIVAIQPAAQWGILQTANGLQRLIKEVILFEHRQRLAPDAQPSLDVAPVPNSKGGFSVRTILAKHLPPPALGTLVTAGFSAGMAAVKALMVNEAIAYTNRARGISSARSWTDESRNPYFADPTEFFAAWREIWDLDGSVNAIGGFSQWVGSLADWQRVSGHYANGKSDRVVRCYHTDYTAWSAASLAAVDPILGNPSPNSSTSAPSSKTGQRDGTNGSAVWFSHGFLTGNGPGSGWDNRTDAPAFWLGQDPPKDIGALAHQAIPTICFGHAAALSQLRKR